jgi:GNAT superfamily N-acetyltransferase
MNIKLSHVIITKNFIINQATIEDCAILKCISESWEEQKLVVGDVIEDNYFPQCVKDGDLPPRGIKDNYSLMIVRLKENNSVVGYFDLYHGYPDSDMLWIGIFVVDKAFRSKGFGKEIIYAVFNEASNNGWNKIGIGVYLKNWSALRFWTSLGFDKIRGIYGDKKYDVHPWNFYIDGDSINVFDFDDSLYGWFALDIGVALYHALWWGRNDDAKPIPNDFTDSIITNFLKGYLSSNQLSNFWLSKIPMFMKFRQICSFSWGWNNDNVDEHKKEQIYNIENDILFTNCVIDNSIFLT